MVQMNSNSEDPNRLASFTRLVGLVLTDRTCIAHRVICTHGNVKEHYQVISSKVALIDVLEKGSECPHSSLQLEVDQATQIYPVIFIRNAQRLIRKSQVHDASQAG